MSVNVPKSVTIKGLPYGDIQIDIDDILCNDITFPGEYNPHGTGLWIIKIGGSYCPIFKAVWGHEHDALDVAVDVGMLDCLMIDDDNIEDYLDHSDDCPAVTNDISQNDWWKDNSQQCCQDFSENFDRLGNASEPFDLDNVGLRKVDLTKQDLSFMMLLAEARGANVEKLSDL